MRILYISHTNLRDGSCIALINILKYMKEKHEILVFMPKATDGIPALSNYCKENGIQYYDEILFGAYIYGTDSNILLRGLRTGVRIIRRLRARRALKKIINEFHPDIVHTNSGVVDIGYDICIKKGIPHVWHLREYQQGMAIIPSRESWLKKIHTNGNYNIAITKGIFEYFNLRSCDKVIYDGPIDTNGTELPEQETRKEKAFLFVAACITNEGKGLLDVLKAFNSFCNTHEGYSLNCIGLIKPNEYFKECEAFIAENNMKDKVKFLGTRSQEEVYARMRKSQALLVASISEGFGFTTAEAMYNDCLVIGRNNTGTKEQLDNGVSITGREIGLRFESWKEMADCMNTAVTQDTKRMRDLAKSVVLTLYTREASSQKLDEYYNSIVARK